MKISLTSVLVNDQEKALRFYTEVLRFEKKQDFPMGDVRFITVVSPESPGIELMLEPMGFEPARTFQRALFDAGIPATAFQVDDLAAEHARLSALGVAFRSPPNKPPAGPATASFDDTCGNVIMLFQP